MVDGCDFYSSHHTDMLWTQFKVKRTAAVRALIGHSEAEALKDLLFFFCIMSKQGLQ